MVTRLLLWKYVSEFDLHAVPKRCRYEVTLRFLCHTVKSGCVPGRVKGDVKYHCFARPVKSCIRITTLRGKSVI